MLLVATASLLAMGQPQFSLVDTDLPGLSRVDVAWGDLNQDGLLEIGATGLGLFAQKTTAVFLNEGNDAFQEFAGIAAPGLVDGAIAWADYDGDGDDDLIVAGFNNDQIDTTLYRNDGGVLLSLPTDILPLAGGSIDWADLEGDGDLDLLITGDAAGGEAVEPRTIIYENQNGQFVDIQASLTGVYQGEARFGDLDADGDQDVAVAGQDIFGASITRVFVNTDGVFTQLGDDLVGARLASVDWADTDDDGDLDLLVSGAAPIDEPPFEKASTILYRNDGNAFVDSDVVLTDIAAGAARFGDWSGDGLPDILLAGGQTVYVYESGDGISELYENVGGDFELTAAELTPVAAADAEFGDYDEDGDLDILLAGSDTANGVGTTAFTLIYRNDGTGSLADMNGDGLLDILDFVAFQQLFQDGHGDADMNADGVHDILDFIAFQDAFVNEA